MEANASDGEGPAAVSIDHEQVIALALSAGGGIFWSLDLVTDKLSWDPGLDALLGIPDAPEADVRARLSKLIKPLVVAVRTTDRWDGLNLEESYETAGKTHWLQFNAQRRDNHLLGIATNVTDRHEDRQELADLADRYRLLIELSPDVIAVHQDGRVVYANPAGVRFTGVDSLTVLLGQPITNFLASESIPEMAARLTELTAPGATSDPAEAVFVRPDGSRFPMEAVSVRTTWAGRPAYQVIMRDVSAQKAAETALRFQAALVEHVSDAIIATDTTGLVTSWNPAAEAIYQLPATAALGRQVGDLVGAPLDPSAVLRGGGVSHVTHRAADGATLTVRVAAAEMDGGYVLVCADETARRRAERQYATVVAALDEGVLVIGPNGLLISANPAAERILGLPEATIIGASPHQWPLYDEVGRRLSANEHPSVQVRRTGIAQQNRVLRVQRRDGRHVWLSISCRAMNPEDSSFSSYVLSFTDITERRAIGERLEHDATHDPLTGLANRTLVLDQLTTVLHEPDRTSTAVLFIDLDKFKVINDSLGHSVGDRVLKIVGDRLRNTIRAGDVVGRLGGDEFVVIASDVRGEPEVRAVTDHLRDSLSRPISVDGRELHVDASIGIVLAGPRDRRAADGLLRDADVAMYHAKTRGRGRSEVFNVELRRTMQRRLRLEQDLRDAVRNGRLWAAYQPVVDLKTNRTVSVEGLLRWTHPVHGSVSPTEFIPLAEESDLINLLGSHVLRETTRELAAQRASGLDIDLKINLSTRQLDDRSFVDAVKTALSTTGLPPTALCLEITESALMRDAALAGETLAELRALGVRLAIDDFGTGYSSLAQLQQLTLDTLKIDRSFVQRLGESADAEAIVTSIIAMAHAVHLTVVAEGVETEAQLELLRALDCDQAQGFYLGKPLPARELWP